MQLTRENVVTLSRFLSRTTDDESDEGVSLALGLSKSLLSYPFPLVVDGCHMATLYSEEGKLVSTCKFLV